MKTILFFLINHSFSYLTIIYNAAYKKKIKPIRIILAIINISFFNY